MRYVFSIITIWVIFLFYPAMAQASEAEKEALARIVGELQYVKQLIADAEQKRKPNSVYAFNYQALRSDFDGVINGLENYLKRPRRTPVLIVPLALQYREK